MNEGADRRCYCAVQQDLIARVEALGTATPF